MQGYLRPAGTCRAYESSVLGHRSVVLENRLLRATVLVDRGAALFELVWKPGDLDVLWRWERGIRPPGYQPSVDLPQGNFQDHFFGGWDLMFPTVDRFQPAAPLPHGYHGEVATLPWQWRLVADCADRVALEASVRCVRSPFVIRRVFCLHEDRPELVVDTRFENVSTVAARYAVGEHIAFSIEHLLDGASLEVDRATLCTMPGPCAPESRLGPGQPVPLAAGGGTRRVAGRDIEDRAARARIERRGGPHRPRAGGARGGPRRFRAARAHLDLEQRSDALRGALARLRRGSAAPLVWHRPAARGRADVPAPMGRPARATDCGARGGHRVLHPGDARGSAGLRLASGPQSVRPARAAISSSCPLTKSLAKVGAGSLTASQAITPRCTRIAFHTQRLATSFSYAAIRENGEK